MGEGYASCLTAGMRGRRKMGVGMPPVLQGYGGGGLPAFCHREEGKREGKLFKYPTPPEHAWKAPGNKGISLINAP